jgi:hypothetical protein
MAKPKFVQLVSRHDTPLYEAELGEETEEQRHLHQLVVHASLDTVHERVQELPHLPAFLGVVDRHTAELVSAFVTASNARILLLHEHRSDSAVRAFFAEVHELYTKAALNPLASLSSRLFTTKLDERVRAAARRFLSSKP